MSDKDDPYADMPDLESTGSSVSRPPDLPSEEIIRYLLGSTLAQIEIASCFRNEPEPLFRILSPILYRIRNL
jgi:hypothetical protein